MLAEGGQYSHITADQIEHAEQTIQELFHTIASIDPRKLTEEQRAHLLGALAGDVVFFKGFGASLAYLQEIGALSKAEQKLASLVEAVDKVMETAPSEVVRVATVDGKVVEVRHKVSLFQKMSKEAVKDLSDTSVLKNAADKVRGTTKGATEAVSKQVEWASHYPKHKPPKNISWKDIIKSTRHDAALYKPGIDIKELELYAWKHGQKVNIPGKNWKVFKCNKIIGVNSGKETCYIRVECSANVIHGHPILESNYLRYLK